MTVPDLETTGSDFGRCYYASYAGGEYEWSNPHWQSFFGSVAERIIQQANPATVVDVGCAKGFLVAALRDRGVDAEGVDPSETAISDAPPSVRDHLKVGTFEYLIGRRWDLIACIEVLEHLSSATAAFAMDAMVQASDLLLVSSTPADFEESTHINVHRYEYWATELARRGFFRRADLDATFLSPWAVFFERRPRFAPAQVVHIYESLLAPTMHELTIKRQQHLELQRRLDAMEEALSTAPEARTVAPPPKGIYGEDLLAVTDRLIGLEAELEELQYRYAVATAGNAALGEHELRSTETWRIGHAVLSPVRAYRRARDRANRSSGRLRARQAR